MKKPQLVSVILPSFNERDNLLLLIPRIASVIGRLSHWRVEIIVVDDNSPDKTAATLKKMFGARIRLIVRKNTRGLGSAIATGILKANGEVIIGMDADGNHDPKYIPALLAALDTSDLAVGSRFVSGGGMADRSRYVMSRMFNLCMCFFGFPVSDSTSGYYAVKKRILGNLGIDKIYYGYGEYHLRLVWLAKKQGIHITEIPVYYGVRRYGQSKSRLPIMLITYMRAALRLVFGATS